MRRGAAWHTSASTPCLPCRGSAAASLPRLLSVLTLHLTAVSSSVLTRRFLRFSAARGKDLLSSLYSCHYLMTFPPFPMKDSKSLKASERGLWCCRNDRHGRLGLLFFCLFFSIYMLSLFLSCFEGDYPWTDLITGKVWYQVNKFSFLISFKHCDHLTNWNYCLWIYELQFCVINPPVEVTNIIRSSYVAQYSLFDKWSSVCDTYLFRDKNVLVYFSDVLERRKQYPL